MEDYKGFIKGSSDLENALTLAIHAHRNQKRSDGKPYVTHPIRVAHTIKKYVKNSTTNLLVKAAYLHDVVEDTDVTLKDIKEMFGSEVERIVSQLTSDRNSIRQIGKKQYLAKRMSVMDSDALTVKLADRLDNVRDIKTAGSEIWREKYKNETKFIMLEVKNNRSDLTPEQEEIIKKIMKKIR